jgi:hypothetical protein
MWAVGYSEAPVTAVFTIPHDIKRKKTVFFKDIFLRTSKFTY